jgi:phosphatidylglycerophosphatase A
MNFLRRAGDEAARCLASFFYLGYSPVAPGTMGALGGAIVFVLLNLFLPRWFRPPPPPGYFIFLAVFFILGVVSAGRGEKLWNRKDASFIVIDEAFSFFLTMFLLPLRPWIMIVGFLLNRLFDIRKPFPCSYLEGLPGGWGVMLDDVIAGAYSNVLLHLILVLTR